MQNRTQREISLINLVSEFEANIELGNSLYLDEQQYAHLIEYYIDEQQVEKANKVTDQALTQFKYRSEFYIVKAKILLKMNKPKATMEYIEKAEAVAPFEHQIKLLKSRALAQLQSFTTALNLLDELKISHNENILVDVLLAESFVYEKMKDFEAMFNSLSELLSIDGSHREALDRVWLCAELGRQYIKSINLHNKVLNKDPYNHLAWYNLGHAYSCIGEYEKAIDALEYSFIIDISFENGYLDCADLCFQLKKYDKSLKFYLEALEVFGPDADLLVFIAESLLELGKANEAKRYLRQGLELDPYNDEIYYNLGKAYLAENGWYKAINAFHKAISIEENREEYYFGLAQAYEAIENFQKAIINYKKATLAGAEQPQYWIEFARFLVKINKHVDALKILDDAEEFTYSAELLFCRSAVDFLMGNRNKGFSNLEEALLEDLSAHKILYTLNPEFKIDREIESMINYYKKELNY